MTSSRSEHFRTGHSDETAVSGDRVTTDYNFIYASHEGVNCRVRDEKSVDSGGGKRFYHLMASVSGSSFGYNYLELAFTSRVNEELGDCV